MKPHIDFFVLPPVKETYTRNCEAVLTSHTWFIMAYHMGLNVSWKPIHLHGVALSIKHDNRRFN